MIYVITETEYRDDCSFERFKALLEGDGDPAEVVSSWRRMIHHEMEAWRKANPQPRATPYPVGYANEEEWAKFGLSQRATSKWHSDVEKFTEALHGKLGADPIEALLKAGFKRIEHKEVSL